MSYGKIFSPQLVYKQTGTKWNALQATLKPNTAITAKYRPTGGNTSTTETFTPTNMQMDVTPQFSEQIINNALRFDLGSKTYVNRDGKLFTDIDPLTGAGQQAGTLGSDTGAVDLTFWATGEPSAVALKSLLTTQTGRPITELTFRAPLAPIKPGSLQLLATQLSGGAINGTPDSNGDYSGAGMTLKVNFETGVVRAKFGDWVAKAGNETKPWYRAENVVGAEVFKPNPVLADSVRFNAVAYKAVPLNADQIGINPVRLPQNGKVRWVRNGDTALIGRTWKTTATVSNNQTVNLSHAASRVWVHLKDTKTPVAPANYSEDLEAGTVKFTNIAASTAVDIYAAYEVMAQVLETDISGRIKLNKQIPSGETFTAGEAYLATVINHGTKFARVSHKFEQTTWGNNWQDSVQGDAPLARYNSVQHPIAVTNAGALTERWLIKFISSTTFQCIGEKTGVLGQGDINAVYAPQNPASPNNEPYFTIAAEGWGQGWIAGNCVRFNTVGAITPIAVAQCINPGTPTAQDHTFELVVGCNVDRPAP